MTDRQCPQPEICGNKECEFCRDTVPVVAQPEPSCAQQKIGPRPAICERCGTGTCTYVENPPNPPVQQRAQPEPVELTEFQKMDLITNWFAEDWAIKKAAGLLDDYASKLAAAKGGAL